MKKFISSLLLSPAIIVVASFGGNIDSDTLYEPAAMIFPSPPTTKDFINDAYKFRLKEHLPIPDYYYAELSIPNPNPPQVIEAALTFKDTIPFWIRKGQLMKESSSYYNADGTIKYVNKRRGNNNNRKGAIGPFQVLRCAFDHMKKEHPDILKGHKYEEMQKNLKLNEEVACMYLNYIYNGRGNQNWDTTIMLYNAGPWGTIDHDSRDYLKAVKKFGKSE